jgi:hypothetical protein
MKKDVFYYFVFTVMLLFAFCFLFANMNILAFWSFIIAGISLLKAIYEDFDNLEF